jgi:hypothetical protein
MSLYRRYDSEVHTATWCALLQSRHQRDQALMHMEHVLSQREVNNQLLNDLLDTRACVWRLLYEQEQEMKRMTSQEDEANNRKNIPSKDLESDLLLHQSLTLSSLPAEESALLLQSLSALPTKSTRPWTDLLNTRSLRCPHEITKSQALLHRLTECTREWKDAIETMEIVMKK